MSQLVLFEMEEDVRIGRLKNWIKFQWAFAHIFYPTIKEILHMAQECRVLCCTVVQECDLEFIRHCE